MTAKPQTPSRRSRCPPWLSLLGLGLALGACAQLPFLSGAEPDAHPATAGAAAEPPGDYEHGKVALAAGRYGLAVLHFRAALRQAPNSVAALNGLGAAFDRLGRFDLSARAYNRALAIDPRGVTTLNNLGYSYFLQGRYDLAAAYLRDAAGRAGADQRIMENRRLVEAAIARAGGPALPEWPAAGAARAPAAEPFKPHLVLAGRGLRHLVTGPAPSGPDRARPRTQRTANTAKALLPGFLAAPMALDGAWTGRPALGVRQGP